MQAWLELSWWYGRKTINIRQTSLAHVPEVSVKPYAVDSSLLVILHSHQDMYKWESAWQLCSVQLEHKDFDKHTDLCKACFRMQCDQDIHRHRHNPQPRMVQWMVSLYNEFIIVFHANNIAIQFLDILNWKFFVKLTIPKGPLKNSTMSRLKLIWILHKCRNYYIGRRIWSQVPVFIQAIRASLEMN